MTLQRAAFLAMVGVVLRAAFIFRNMILPIAGVLDLELAIYFNAGLTAICLPAVWIAYLWTVWRKRAVRWTASIAAATILLHGVTDLMHQSATISLLSLDSWTLLAGSTLPAVIWIRYLLHSAGWGSKPRFILWYLLFAILVQFGFAIAGALEGVYQLRQFWNVDARIWTVFGFALAQVFYWATQATFVREAQRN